MNNFLDTNKLFSNNDDLALKQMFELNEITKKFGLTLTKKQIINLIDNRNTILKDLGRIEIGSGILDKIVYEFYDSPYIDKYNYLETLEELTYIFYQYQIEFEYKLTDEQILKYLKKCFNGECAGSLELLKELKLSNLKEYIENEKTIYEQFS